MAVMLGRRFVSREGRKSWIRRGYRPQRNAGRWPTPAVTTTATTRYDTAVAAAWAISTTGELPILEGTLIRLQADHLPSDRNPSHLAVVATHRR